MDFSEVYQVQRNCSVEKIVLKTRGNNFICVNVAAKVPNSHCVPVVVNMGICVFCNKL